MDGGGRGIIGTVIKRQCIFHSVSKHAKCGKGGLAENHIERYCFCEIGLFKF